MPRVKTPRLWSEVWISNTFRFPKVGDRRTLDRWLSRGWCNEGHEGETLFQSVFIRGGCSGAGRTETDTTPALQAYTRQKGLESTMCPICYASHFFLV
ncbi:hypothetical protein TNCV_4427311 [Trichonephila clavipes]|nr:hypothetical protein TNCV_4427311 [Trichonephila clavipes]